MANDRKSATSTLTARVSSAVGDELREAARARWDASADVFVWRARRCAEAVLYAVLHREGVDVEVLAKQRKGLDQLLEHKQIDGALSRETRAQLASLRDFGNIAAHYQLRGGVSSDSADAIARLLAGMLREFYAYEREQVPAELAGALRALTERSAREPTASELELEQMRRESDGLRRTLNATLAAPTAPQHRKRSYLGVAVAFALTGAAIAVVVVRTQYDAAPAPAQATLLDSATTQAPVAPVPTPVTPEPAPAPSSPAPPDAPSPVLVEAPTPPAHARGVTRCSAPMRLIHGGATVADFCIDAAPVREGAYRSCVTGGGCAHPPRATDRGCNWESSLNFFAANCLPWSLARAYCAHALGPKGDLPTRSEWEAANAARPRITVETDVTEWSADPQHPGTRLTRGPRMNDGTFRWSARPESEALHTIGFRCVLRATPPL